MKRVILAAGIVSLLAGASAAYTMEKPYYVSLKIGGAFADDMEGKTKAAAPVVAGDRNKTVTSSFEGNATYTVAGGLRLHPAFRLELEGGYRKLYTDSLTAKGITGLNKANGALTVKTLMANAIYDLPVSWLMKPYLLAGIGMARTDNSVIYKSTISSKGDSTDLAYQVGAGVTIPLTEVLNADLGYRFLNVSAEDMSNVLSSKDHRIHEFYAGVQLGF
ncbi:MAG: porin family protein [Magnetococcales bacterium]|nr:porin family protein [Magnetococcales bacterium]